MRKIRKGDLVAVIAGKEFNRGALKTGKVLRVVEDGKRVVIEKINLIKRHTKANRQGREAGIIEKEAPIDTSNVALVSPTTGKPVRVGFKTIENARGESRKVRVVHKTGEVLDKV
jgi:large subunit ribosomal protein L24